MSFYRLIRLVILALTAIGVFFFRKKRKHRPVMTRAIILIGAIIDVCLVLLPFENLFMHFETAEKAINYYKLGEIATIVEGSQSCYGILNYGQENYGTCVIPRSPNGYQLPYFGLTECVAKINGAGRDANIFYVSGSDDYYILVNLFWNDPVESVTDSLGYPVQIVHSQVEGYESHSYTLLSYSDGYPEDYHLWINGEEAVSFE